jgi:hypothetical protein
VAGVQSLKKPKIGIIRCIEVPFDMIPTLKFILRNLAWFLTSSQNLVRYAYPYPFKKGCYGATFDDYFLKVYRIQVKITFVSYSLGFEKCFEAFYFIQI